MVIFHSYVKLPEGKETYLRLGGWGAGLLNAPAKNACF